MEKRVYRSGYNWGWNKNHNAIHQQETKTNDAEIEPIQKGSDEQAILTNNTQDNRIAATEADNNLSASIDSKSFFIPSHQAISLQKATIQKTADFRSATRTVLSKSIQTLFSKQRIQSPAADELGFSGMAIAGFLCSAIGVLLWFTIVAPIVLGILGLVFSLIGLGETGKGKKKGKGFAIAGIIIPFLPIVLFILIIVGLYGTLIH